MNDLFSDMLDFCVVIYLDDILIYLENLDNHQKHVKEVLGWLKDNGLYASVINFIWPYLHQFFNNSHGLNGTQKPLKRPFDRYQSCLEAISDGRDIRQIN